MWIVIYETVMSVICFGIMRSDKKRAVRKRRRISEKTLLILTLLAPIGSVIAMNFKFRYGRHKINKWYFPFTAVLGLTAHFAAIYFLIKNGLFQI